MQKRSQRNSNPYNVMILSRCTTNRIGDIWQSRRPFGGAGGHWTTRLDIFDGVEGHLGFKKDIWWHGDNISRCRRTFYGTEQQVGATERHSTSEKFIWQCTAHFTAQTDIWLHRRSFDCAEGHLTSQNDTKQLRETSGSTECQLAALDDILHT